MQVWASWRGHRSLNISHIMSERLLHVSLRVVHSVQLQKAFTDLYFWQCLLLAVGMLRVIFNHVLFYFVLAKAVSEHWHKTQSKSHLVTPRGRKRGVFASFLWGCSSADEVFFWKCIQRIIGGFSMKMKRIANHFIFTSIYFRLFIRINGTFNKL